MRGEGFGTAAVRFELQLYVRRTGGEEIVLSLPARRAPTPADLAQAVEAATTRLGADTDGELVLTTAGLLASAAVPHFRLARAPRVESDVATARKGGRAVYLDAAQPAREVAVYAREQLGHGHKLDGPVIVESDQTTLFVPPLWRLEIDRFNNAVLLAAPGRRGQPGRRRARS
jgi:N-methylhydantoinase A/oxoprolinase/acetone carboxylase beta subunit